jgi:ABC-type multidrug transport system ATPase subunit
MPRNINNTKKQSIIRERDNAEWGEDGIRRKESRVALNMLAGAMRDIYRSSHAAAVVAGANSGDADDERKAQTNIERSNHARAMVRRPGLYENIRPLIDRHSFNLWRSAYQLRLTFGRMIVGGVMLGGVAFEVAKDADGDWDGISRYDDTAAYTEIGCLFLIICMAVVQVSLAIPAMHHTFQIIRSEVRSGLYSSAVAWFSIFIVEVPVYILSSLCMGMIVYAMLGLDLESGPFFGSVIGNALCAYSLAALCSITTRTGTRATFLYSTVGSMCLLFSGFFFPARDSTALWTLAYKGSFSRWALQSLIMNAFRHDDQELLREQYGFNNHSPNDCLNWLFVWFFGCQFCVIASLLTLAPKLTFIDEIDVNETVEEMDTNDARDPMLGLSPVPPSTPSAAYTPPLVVGVQSPLGQDSTNVKRRLDQDLGEGSSECSEEDVVSSHGATDIANKRAVILHNFSFPVVSIPTSAQATLDMYRLKVTHGDTLALMGITGRLAAGQSCCIISGNDEESGSMLLKVLAGRFKTKKAVKVEGSVLMNNEPVHVPVVSFRDTIFVPAGDIELWPHLTVRETLFFAGCLRSPATMIRRRTHKSGTGTGYEEMCASDNDAAGAGVAVADEEGSIANAPDIKIRVQEVLSLFRLRDVADTKVGPGGSNLSPSQGRLLSIAMELIHQPSIVLLEDPIQGLSLVEGYEVASALYALSKGGRIVICTMPFPSEAALFSFDNLLMLGAGMQIYFGPATAAYSHFDKVGFLHQKQQTISEFLLSVASDKGIMKDVRSKDAGSTRTLPMGEGQSKRYAAQVVTYSMEDLHDIWRSIALASDATNSSPNRLLAHGSASRACGEDALWTRCQEVDVGAKAAVLMSRGWTILLSDEPYLISFCMRALAAGSFLGIVWYHVDTDDAVAKVHLLSCCYLCLNLVLVDIFATISRNKQVFLRESIAEATNVLAFWGTEDTPWLALNFICCILCTIPMYILGELRPGMEHFFYFLMLSLAAMVCNVELAYLVTLSSSSSMSARMIFNGIIMPLQFIFSGSVILFSSMSSVFSWISFVNPMAFYLAGVVHNEFKGNSGPYGIQFGDLKEFYGYNLTTAQAITALWTLASIFKALWYLRLRDDLTLTGMYKKAKATNISESFANVRESIHTAGLRFKAHTRTSTTALSEVSDTGIVRNPAVMSLNSPDEDESGWESELRRKSVKFNQLQLPEDDGEEENEPSTGGMFTNLSRMMPFSPSSSSTNQGTPQTATDAYQAL